MSLKEQISSQEGSLNNGTKENSLTPVDIEDRHSQDHDHINGEPIYFTGARYYLLWTALFLSIFLTAIEIPIVTTSVATITEDLGGFERATWITSSYLLGYVGVLIIWTKLSDIFGRKLLGAISLGLFIVFSAGCGAAQTMTQLIICRAFQGIGGGGTTTVFYVMAFELIPEVKYAGMTGAVALVFGTAMITGPIIGGAISDSSYWRWIFIFNVPAAVPALIILLVYLPSAFPNHGKPGFEDRSFKSLFSNKNLARVDWIGVAAMWIGIVALTAALEEAGISHGWDSATVIALLVVGVVMLIAFLGWECIVTNKLDTIEPVFPWHFATSRIMVGLLLAGLSQGMPWIGGLFQIPQKFQVVHGESPIAAGIKTIPFSGAAPVGAMSGAIIVKKGVPPIYVILFASVLQIVGFALLGTLPISANISKAQYGYQILAGYGSGASNSLLTLLAPLSVARQKDKSVAIGALNQSRFLGGAVGLAIINTSMSGFIKGRLHHILTAPQVDSLLESAKALLRLSNQNRSDAIRIYAEGYNLQFQILAGLASLQVIGSIIMWQRSQIKAS